MRSEGHPYRGVLYAGLMLTRSGPKVLEFNCRFGDPECQLILPLLEGNLAEICEGDLQGVRWREGRTYGIVLAAAGYPEAPRSGDRIDGFDELPEGAVVFHAGTRVGPNGEMLTAGGRVLTVVAEDRETALRAAEKVSFSGKQYRNDIGVEQPSVVGATAP
jgi:phosphoribosylamine--glycine ligase